jgi:CRISPR system Cascade subunit CasC
MTNNPFITLHIVNDIPWSNLNRDDSGTPKRTILGGVERGLLSSQSIKRAIRKDFEARILENNPGNSIPAPPSEMQDFGENASLDSSVRSRYLVEWASRRAEVLAHERGVTFNKKKAYTLGNKIIKALTGGEDTIIWLSIEELESLSVVLLEGVASEEESSKDNVVLDKFINNGTTGSLAIAAFGRMFASSASKNTDGSIAVSPAISTHENLIETDYFIAGDDFGWFGKDSKTKEVTENYKGAGAAHIGTSLYTSGIFYRTVTIDGRDLLRNWTGASGEFAKSQLNQLVESIIRSLPTGKKNSTAPYTVPTLVIAQQQNYREALSIETPVTPEGEGGFKSSTMIELKRQFELAKKFNNSNYGDTLISGSEGSLFGDVVTLATLTSQVAEWILS